MSTEIITGILIVTSTGTISFIAQLIYQKLKSHKLGSDINTWLIRNSLINIYKDCLRVGKRTDLDTKIFYEGYEIYTKKLGQNSYICQEVEPAFKNIKKQN